jgi:immune inhibitor A
MVALKSAGFRARARSRIAQTPGTSLATTNNSGPCETRATRARRSVPGGETTYVNRPRIALGIALAALAAFFAFALAPGQDAAASEAQAPVVTGWTLVKFVQPQPACTGSGFRDVVHYQRLECGFGYAAVSGTTLAGTLRSIVKVSFLDRDGNALQTQTATARTTAGSEGWQFSIQPQRLPSPWPAGPVTIRVTEVDPDGTGPLANQVGNFGETGIVLNALGATIAAGAGDHKPGEPVQINGSVYEIEHVSVLTSPEQIAVPATVSVRVRTPAGEIRGPYGPFTADAQGRFTGTLPAAATAGVTATAETGFKTTVSIEVVDAFYDDPASGRWEAKEAGSGGLALFVPPSSLLLSNSYVSDVGWVKPGETYPFRLFVRNYTSSPAAGTQVTLPAPDGTTFTNVTTTNGSGSATISGGAITWDVGTVPAAVGDVPAIRTLVVEARADTLGQDPQIVWKNLSTTATLTSTGGPTLTSSSHGPKVIPPKATYDTARYGDRPFAVVAADYFDRKHADVHTAESLREKINSPDITGSTFNLYQEMSYGQLFPNGTVPSSGMSTAGWDVQWKSDRYKGSGFTFTEPKPAGACTGTSYKSLQGSAVYGERIHDGWYQLPGDTGYYGGDTDSFANVAAPQVAFIDQACGPIGKAVYDAAHIADPEIDYSDYDTDKDGVVDFFMLVFAGIGGNGGSQLNVPPYDNIWPHSSSLEGQYTDAETGLGGYISDDQLKDLEGRPLYFVDSARDRMTTSVTAYPVYVRVGPYNVNPEAAIDRASVISHEYGHSLGLPDYYSSSGSGRETYGDWNLMATDKSQNIDVNGKQELGWLVPRVLKPGQSSVAGWKDSKANTHRIDWVQPDGTPYALSGSGVNNGEAYVAKLPGRRILDPAKVPSGAHVWWSDSGDNFNCVPSGGHNLDVYVPALKELPAGTPVKLTFKSSWDTEWDYDYGYVMGAVSNDDGSVSYTALPSAKGYTTPQSQNPNAIGCQLTYGNGITGSSGSYAAGTQAVDRLAPTTAYPAPVFLPDEYDLTSLAGRSSAIRFSYSTDGGVAHIGWFIDDVQITTGDGRVLYDSTFENGEDEPELYNGGCRGGLSTSDRCTSGWKHLNAAAESEADHAYYLEMRDRSGFDANSHGENDRAALAFSPGLLLVYTDENSGYGNTGEGGTDAPNQSPLDSQPEIGVATPNLDDAAFTALPGKNAFSDSKTAARPGGWVDNYKDAASAYPDGNWHFDFGCLSFLVDSMTGTGIGPATSPGDLQGNVTFTLGSGCAPFDYGFGVPNAAPTAAADAKPASALVGTPITFDGSGSFDDRQPGDQLTYDWAFGDGATATGRTVTHAYAKAGSYTATLTVKDAEGLTDTATVTVTATGAPDLKVTAITSTVSRETATFTATVANVGNVAAGASTTEFLLDGTTVLGSAATPSIAPGASVQVTATWSTKRQKGDHRLTVTADKGAAVAESDETNNAAEYAFTVKGNKVQNGSFEEPGTTGGAPAGWTPQSTSAGSTSWSGSGADGSKAATASGNGGNAALAGSPTWTSAPVPVAPGEVLDFAVAVNSLGASSPASAGLLYLGPLGNVLQKVTLVTAPLTTSGFQLLESTVTIPVGVAQVQVVLTGFAATDVATAGTVTFDDVGLYTH